MIPTHLAYSRIQAATEKAFERDSIDASAFDAEKL